LAGNRVDHRGREKSTTAARKNNADRRLARRSSTFAVDGAPNGDPRFLSSVSGRARCLLYSRGMTMKKPALRPPAKPKTIARTRARTGTQAPAGSKVRTGAHSKTGADAKTAAGSVSMPTAKVVNRSRGPKVPKAPTALQVHVKTQAAKAPAKPPRAAAASPAAITLPAAAVTVLAYCRAGFEADLVNELITRIGGQPIAAAAIVNSGFVRLSFPPAAAKWVTPVLRESSIFARQLMLAQATPVALGDRDRVTPIMAAARAFLAANQVRSVCAVWLEHPDTNEGKSLSKLGMALQGLVSTQLEDAGLLFEKSPHRLHVFLTDKGCAWLGLSDVRHSSSWPMGIPRLRMPSDAPSRSTLKLAEAIHVFLGDEDERLFQPDMRAVDLGAAPGGWTWQLIHRGLHVIAIDNGDLRGELIDNAMVRHLREDGFKYRPKKPVDWMVCDMVESPSRIARLVGLWLSEGWARHVIFNLKLPMKKRFEEVERCSLIIDEALGDRASRAVLRIKQLYHDREEVTGYCGFPPREK
jgi:23S rRNA (cytidine2498-2'-O)-methyltransferase